MGILIYFGFAANKDQPIPAKPEKNEDEGILPGIPNPSQCLLLKNMFNPAEETDEDWDLDLKVCENEISSNCNKYKDF